jgi:hypothetical protein
MSEARDRDEHGRARNARPRDALGRPLSRLADGADIEPEPVFASAAQTLDEAQGLLDSGRPFRAHEVLEAAWKAAPDGERDLWQGLAQLAVGVTHAARGNRGGAVALLTRGSERLSNSRPAPWNVDIDGLLLWADDATTLLHESTSAVELPAPTLRVNVERSGDS